MQSKVSVCLDYISCYLFGYLLKLRIDCHISSMTNNLGNLSSGIEEVLTVKSLSGVVLDSPIACLAFAPNHGDMVVVGTYQLQEGQSRKDEVNAQQSRNGGLEVFEMVERSL